MYSTGKGVTRLTPSFHTRLYVILEQLKTFLVSVIYYVLVIYIEDPISACSGVIR